MHSSREFCLIVTILSILTSQVSSAYTHAAFVHALRQQKQHLRSRSVWANDPSEEYSLQMNSTASLGIPPCSRNQCQRIAVVGAGK